MCVCVSGQEATLQDIRLVQGASNGVRDGRVEVQYQGLWGTICQDGFDNQDAGVICRMLGYECAIHTIVTSHSDPEIDLLSLLLLLLLFSGVSPSLSS